MTTIDQRTDGDDSNQTEAEARGFSNTIDEYRYNLDEADGFADIWEIVKNVVRGSLGKYRVGMLLFLDDLPLRLGAYHPLGTNTMVLNRSLIQIVEAQTQSKRLVNSFVFSLLLHEYLHALGYISENEVRELIYRISKECFGEDHEVTTLALESPWTLLKGVPLNGIELPRRVIEIVKDLEKANQRYIV